METALATRHDRGHDDRLTQPHDRRRADVRTGWDGQAQVLDVMDREIRKRGMDPPMIGHDLGVNAHMGDRVAVMRGGQIVETLPARQLLTGALAHDYSRELRANCFPGKSSAADAPLSGAAALTP